MSKRHNSNPVNCEHVQDQKQTYFDLRQGKNINTSVIIGSCHKYYIVINIHTSLVSKNKKHTFLESQLLAIVNQIFMLMSVQETVQSFFCETDLYSALQLSLNFFSDIVIMVFYHKSAQ